MIGGMAIIGMLLGGLWRMAGEDPTSRFTGLTGDDEACYIQQTTCDDLRPLTILSAGAACTVDDSGSL